MPLVKHHDTLTDLIRKGAEKKQGLHDERRRQSAYYSGWEIDDLPECIAYNDDNRPVVDPEEQDSLLRASSLFLWCVEMQFIKCTRLIALVGAFVILTVDASSDPETLQGLEDFVYALDFVVNIYYIIDGVLKMLSMYSYVSIAKNCGQSLTTTTYLRRSGGMDVPLSALNLVYNRDTAVNKWLHLIRCVALSFFFLEQTPQIDVLMSGISAGLRSTLYTWSLMVLIFLVYAATGVIFFKDNDPYHFGNIGMAMWTYFEMTTLDNWSDVLNINYHGCDEFDGGYYEPGHSLQTIQTDYGVFYLPICATPSRKPLVSSALFTLFILMSGFVMVSLTVAFVTTGINNKLRTLKEEEDQLELLVEMGKAPVKKSSVDQPPKVRRRSVVQSAFVKSSSTISRTMSGFGGHVAFRSDKIVGGGGLSMRHTPSLDSSDSNMASSSVDKSPQVAHPDISLNRSSSNMSAESLDSNSNSSLSTTKKEIKKKKTPKPNKPGRAADTELLRALLLQVWKADESNPDGILKDESLLPANMKRRKGMLADTKKVGNFNAVSFKRTMKNMKKKGPTHRSEFMKLLMRMGVYMRSIVGNRYYNYSVSLIIVFSAGEQLMAVEGRISDSKSELIGILCQIVFTFDLGFKFLSNSPKYITFLDNSWNVFDSVLVFFLWIPILAVGAPNIVYFELLKVLRIIRVLKIFSWIVEVNIIMKSISTSARCLAYVVFLMLVFFYHFGVAGVYLFSENDPFHFGNIGKALITLFQVSTLDDWSDIARMNMYGCLYIGYDPQYCTEDDSYGWGWVAAWYFIVFVIVGVMVLVALFVGVIITSMELLQLSIKEEDEMLKKVATKQSEFGISDACAHTLLEIFDMIDVCANGRLTLHELKPILGMVSLQDAQQYELFHKIDEDMSGKIDFAEFVELIHLLNIAFMQKTKNVSIQRRSTSSLKRFMGGDDSENNILSMLTAGFKTKKSLKSVAKMSILAQRLKKPTASSKEDTLSRISEGSDSASPNHRSSKRFSSKWGSVIGSVISRADSGVEAAAAEPIELQSLPTATVAGDATSDSTTPSMEQGKWFGKGGNATIVPTANPGDAVLDGEVMRVSHKEYGGVMLAKEEKECCDFGVDPSIQEYSYSGGHSEERYDAYPLSQRNTGGGSNSNDSSCYNGTIMLKGTTFSNADSSSPASSLDHQRVKRPTTGDAGAVGGGVLSPNRRAIASANTISITPSGGFSPNGSPGAAMSRRFNKRFSKTSPLKAKPTAAVEPNFFFNYGGGGGDEQQVSNGNGRYSTSAGVYGEMSSSSGSGDNSRVHL